MSFQCIFKSKFQRRKQFLHVVVILLGTKIFFWKKNDGCILIRSGMGSSRLNMKVVVFQ